MSDVPLLFADACTLPSRMTVEARAALTAAGVRFMEPIPGNPALTYVELPAGWRKMRVEIGPGHLYLQDNRLRRRAELFYVPTEGNPSAWLKLLCRFGHMIEPKHNSLHFIVTDGGAVVFTSHNYAFDGIGTHQYDEAVRRARQEVETWLAGRHPNWRDPAQYWD